ncbi:DUF2383 domain-containing protein [Nannocystaceae bacterium ST9]
MTDRIVGMACEGRQSSLLACVQSLACRLLQDSTMATQTETDIKQLNSFLRGELSAVETYTQCIKKLEDTGSRVQLDPLRASHAMRVNLLTARVASLGGEPEATSGAWGSLAKLAEGSAAVFGASAAIAMLEEGEDHGKAIYLKDIEDLSASNRQFVNAEILPEQLRTHNLLAAIKTAG